MVAARDNLIQEFRTIADFVRWGATAFVEADLYFGHGTDNALDESLSLVLHALGLSHDIPEALLTAQLTMAEKKKVLALLGRRIDERLPAPYLTGTARFMGLDFHVDSRVIVPRSPIAELIERGFEPWLTESPQTVLDLCTGSGCIAIACAYAFPEAMVHATDLSPDALAVAQKNVTAHHLDARVLLKEGDLFAPLSGHRYELIVANPPYVGDEEMDTLPQEYRHEPDMALRSGSDGLEAVTGILTRASAHLSEGGLLVIEVGNTQTTLMRQFPNLAATWVELELGGGGVFVIDKDTLDSQRFFAS